MRFIISHNLIRAAHFLILSSQLKFENISEIFNILAEFLKKEPLSSFHSEKENKFKGMKEGLLPLVLTDEAEKRLKSALSKYPSVYQSGSAHKFLSMAYLIGQFLVVVVSHYDFLKLVKQQELRQEELKEIDKVFNKLYDIWRSRNKMNAAGVSSLIQGKTPEAAQDELIRRLSVSAKITESIAEPA